jgi:hypothetical protein
MMRHQLLQGRGGMTTEICVARARKWLNRNRLGGIEPSALLVDRLTARRRGSWIVAIAALASVGAWSVFDDPSEPAPGPHETDVGDLVGFMVINLALVFATLIGLWWVYRQERRLLATRTTRTAHPAAASVARVLGTGHVAASLVVYGGGLLVGAAAALLAPRPERALALAFLVSVAVVAALSGLALAGVLRRPSVAEDSESLLVDDILRTDDAHTVVAPLPLVVALVAAIGEPITPWLFWMLLGYTVIGAIAWLLAAFSTYRAPAGLAVIGG